MIGHAVQHPARAGDQAIAALLLNPGQATEEFVGDVFAQTLFAEAMALDGQGFGANRRHPVGVEIAQLEHHLLGIVDLAQVVADANHFKPLGIGSHHPPADQIVQGRAPQHGLFAACIHGDVAADARRFGGGRVDRKDQSGGFSGIGHPLGHNARLGMHCGDLHIQAGQAHHLHRPQGFEFFSVDDRAVPGQRNRAAGISGTTAARDDGQSQLDASLDQGGHFGL